MKLVILLVLLVGFASSRKIKLVKSIDFADDILPVKPLIDVQREKRSAESSATTGHCWRANGPSHWKANCEFPQRDIPRSDIAAQNLADCQIACRKNAKCTHFTYNFLTKFCYMKKSDASFKEMPSEESICGFVPKNIVSPAKFDDNGLGRNCWNSDKKSLSSWGAHCKFDGQELSNYNTMSFTMCRIACKNNQQCTHFNYDYVNNMCYLIRSSRKSQLESQKNNYFCGLINRPFVPPVTTTTTTTTVKPVPSCWNTENPPLSSRVTYWGDQCDFNGRDVTRYSTSSLSDCRMSCSNDLLCTHFTFNVLLNMCYLKRSTAPFSSNRARNGICGFVLNPNGSIPRCP